MPINSTHPQYDKRAGQWKRCRDVYEGTDAVKNAGEAYLPKLSGQKDEEYKAYQKRAQFFEATTRTIEGYVGAVMRIDPVVNGDMPEAWATDITNTGINLKDFIATRIVEQLLMGRQGILVDRNEQRPYLTGYTTEAMTNWSSAYVVLKESVTVPKDGDKYDLETIEQYREITKSENGTVVHNIYRKSKETEEWALVDTIEPTKRGNGIKSDLFIPLTLDGQNFNPEKPPLLGLVDVNLSHYMTSADLEHGRHFVALPTPVIITGASFEGDLHIGSGKALVLPEDSDAKYLEFSGQGLKALETGSQEKREQMAALGAQVIQGQKNQAEAAETVRLKQNSETSILTRAVQTVENAMNKALAMMAEWEGVTVPTVKINTDYIDSKLTPQEMTALMGAWQGGAISLETLLWNLQRGEVINPDTDLNSEIDRINLESGAPDA